MVLYFVDDKSCYNIEKLDTPCVCECLLCWAVYWEWTAVNSSLTTFMSQTKVHFLALTNLYREITNTDLGNCLETAQWHEYSTCSKSSLRKTRYKRIYYHYLKRGVMWLRTNPHFLHSSVWLFTPDPPASYLPSARITAMDSHTQLKKVIWTEI